VAGKVRNTVGPSNLINKILNIINKAIRITPDTDFAGYPAYLKAGYRIPGRISSAGWIPDIQLDFQLFIQMYSKI
jgi:hypothetical protein